MEGANLNYSQGNRGGTANGTYGQRIGSRDKHEERKFVSRKHPRYYKSYALTPSAE